MHFVQGDHRLRLSEVRSAAFLRASESGNSFIGGARAVPKPVSAPHQLRGRLFGVMLKPASLIGRSGSSTFRLSTATVSMSLTGSRFSSESAPRPFHHGIRRQGGTILHSALPSF